MSLSYEERVIAEEAAQVGHVGIDAARVAGQMLDAGTAAALGAGQVLDVGRGAPDAGPGR